MFPTTVWTTIREAGAADGEALERFACSYRAPVVRYLRRRGLAEADAEDAAQDVFVRLLRGDVLARADRSRGRFRSLLASVAVRTLADRLRRVRAEEPAGDALDAVADDLEIVERDAEFDREWLAELVERALGRLRREGSPYHAVLRGHLRQEAQDRNKLWIARGKLLAQLRKEIALTCSSRAEYEAEVAYLAELLGPARS